MCSDGCVQLVRAAATYLLFGLLACSIQTVAGLTSLWLFTFFDYQPLLFCGFGLLFWGASEHNMVTCASVMQPILPAHPSAVD